MKKMNLVFTRLGVKSTITMILLFGLIIFTGQRAEAQYVSVEQAKEILSSYRAQLPEMPIVSQLNYSKNDKMVILSMKHVFGDLIVKSIKEGSSIGKSIDIAYDTLKSRMGSGKIGLLDKVKSEYVSILKDEK